MYIGFFLLQKSNYQKEFVIMSKNIIFKGVATALVTPLNENGIDYESFGRLIDWQIEQGINALVICGTTGEASTLTDEEHRNAIEFAVKRANKRVPIIAGTGANDTAYAVSVLLCRSALEDPVLGSPDYESPLRQRPSGVSR